MTTTDEPLPDEPTHPEIEEISDDLIIEPGETLPGAVVAPDAEPSSAELSEAEPSHGELPPPTAPREPEPRPEPAAVARRATPAPEPKVAQPRPVARLTPSRPMAQAAPPAVAEPAPQRLDEASTRVIVVQQPVAQPSRSVVPIALLSLLLGLGGGFVAGQYWERRAEAAGQPLAAPKSAATAPAPEEEPAPAAPGRPAVTRPTRTAKPARSTQPTRTSRASEGGAAKGKLDVTAPAGAEIFLDGKRIGRGSMKVDVKPGRHRIEVKLGKSRVGETFEAEPGITWTYEVTPTRQ